MKEKLALTTIINLKDYAKEITLNGVSLNKADFYEISKKDKEAMISIQTKLDQLYEKAKENPIKVIFSDELSKLNKEMRTLSLDLVMTANKKNVLKVGISTKLKECYQEKLESNKVEESLPKVLYGIEWLESERGWGQRPDGYSIHSSKEEALRFVKDFYSKQPKETPDEYSRPVKSESTMVELMEVSDSLYEYLKVKNSVWLHMNNKSAYKTYDATELIKNMKS